MSKYLEIHAIQAVPIANLNRDGSGLPKTFNLGGSDRTALSSQSQKYAVRHRFMEDPVYGNSCGIRSRLIPDAITEKILEFKPSIDPAHAVAWVAETISASGLGTMDGAAKSRFLAGDEEEEAKPKKKAGKTNPETSGKTKEVILISHNEINSIAEAIAAKEDALTKREVKEIMLQTPAEDIALFGRMFASENDYSVDACSQVAYAFSTHESHIQPDYFITGDDLSGQNAAAHLDNKPLSSYTMYRYANVNLDSLAEEIGNRDKAIQIATDFLKAFAMTLPSGYQNSTASSTMPSLTYLTIRDDQPINFAPAFEKAVESDNGYTAPSCLRIKNYADKLYNSFASKPEWDAYSSTELTDADTVPFLAAIDDMKKQLAK